LLHNQGLIQCYFYWNVAWWKCCQHRSIAPEIVIVVWSTRNKLTILVGLWQSCSHIVCDIIPLCDGHHTSGALVINFYSGDFATLPAWGHPLGRFRFQIKLASSFSGCDLWQHRASVHHHQRTICATSMSWYWDRRSLHTKVLNFGSHSHNVLLGLLNFWFASLSAHQGWHFSCNSGLNRWVLTFFSLWFRSLPRFHLAIFFSSPVLFYGVQYDFTLVKKCVGHIMVIWQSSWNIGQWS
jgi:hypothetical protein